jgi:endonuclease/exonuclease/phosphatase family metal-dependent hydrolase/predicted TIM-barrel fold metal-dependent hydrolase
MNPLAGVKGLPEPIGLARTGESLESPGMFVPCLRLRARAVACIPAWFAIMNWLVAWPGHGVATAADAVSDGAGSPDELLLKDCRPRSIFKVPQTTVERARFPVIDMHSHAYARTEAEVEHWVRTMDAVGIEKTIVLTGATGQRFDELTVLYGRHPDRFELWCGVDFSGFDQPGFGPAAVAELERCAQQGATGVGELSDKGGGLVRNSGGMHLDDPRMDLFLEKCAELGLAVNIHVGEDRWMYEPMNAHNDGLMNAFKWRIPENPEVLRHDAVIATLDRALQRHRRTTFIACHFANCCYDLSILGRMLEAHPNLHADISARFGETAPIPRSMARFYETYQDRLHYGTDMGLNAEMYRTTFRILETADEHFYEQDLFNYHWPLHGFALGEQLLRKLYGDNARRILNAERSATGHTQAFEGDELYVRARILSSGLKENPFAEGEREQARTQPVLPAVRVHSTSAAPVRVVPYNIRYANPADGENIWANRREAMAAYLRGTKADIIGLQEVEPQQRADLADALTDYAWYGVGRNAEHDEDEGTPIFYRRDRFDVIASGTFWLSPTPEVAGSRGWDAALPRVASWVRLRDLQSGRELLAVNTHFDHRGSEARLESGRMIVNRIQELAAAGTTRLPVILTGDFNGFKAISPGNKIDHIFVCDVSAVLSHRIENPRVDGRFVSDHLPIVAEIEITGGGTGG